MLETVIKSILVAGLIMSTMMIPNSPERRIIVPVNGANSVGPYSPGLLVGNYLYASGQGVRDKDGAMPESLAAQTRQCLENVKAIVIAAGLTMEHVVHMQLYLEKMSWLGEVDRVYAEYFPKNPPARVVIGTAKMPTDTTVEMTAVATRKGVKRANGSASYCAADGSTIYCSAQPGAGANEKTVQAQVQAVMKKLQAGLAAHGADFSHTVATNVYLDDIREFKPMNETYATFFSSSPPTRTTVQPFPIVAQRFLPLARISLVA